MIPGHDQAAAVMPEMTASIMGMLKNTGLTGRRDPMPMPVVFATDPEGLTASVRVHENEPLDMQRKCSGLSGYMRFTCATKTDQNDIEDAIARLGIMDLRARRMKAAGRWRTGDRHPARFWMCDSVFRRLLDTYDVRPRDLQSALGSGRGITVGVPREEIGLKPVRRQGPLLVMADYGVIAKTARTLPGNMHRFEMYASNDRVTKFKLPLAPGVTFNAKDDNTFEDGRFLEIAGDRMPATLISALIGKRAYDVVRHPLLDVDDAFVTHGDVSEEGTVLHLTAGHAFVGDPA